MRAGQLGTFLEAVEKLPAIKWKGTRAKQIPVNCMKHSARIKAVAFITPQDVMKTVVIKYINLCEHVGGLSGEGGEHSAPLASRTLLRSPPRCSREALGTGASPESGGFDAACRGAPARGAALVGWPGVAWLLLSLPQSLCVPSALRVPGAPRLRTPGPGPALLQPWGCVCTAGGRPGGGERRPC